MIFVTFYILVCFVIHSAYSPALWGGLQSWEGTIGDHLWLQMEMEMDIHWFSFGSASSPLAFFFTRVEGGRAALLLLFIIITYPSIHL